ncbi:MAG: TetR/AcrR family transcriptional regulator [Polyangiales bacterium]
MARPRNDPAREPTAARILRHARAAFAAKGFEEASLADIARAAGVRAPTVLHHYASKEQLYDAVLRAFYADLTRTLGAPLLQATAEHGSVVTALFTVLRDLPEPDRDLLVTVVTEVVHGGRGADTIADAVEPLFALLTPVVTAELPHLSAAQARPRLLMASLLVLFAVPSARTPPGLERLRKLVWAEPGDALPLALGLLAPPGGD